MDRNPYRDDNGTDEPETYWRRRAITLVGGLGVLGLLVWAMSGGGGKPPAGPSTSSMSAAAYPSTPAAPAVTATAGADAAVPGLSSPSPSATSTKSLAAQGQAARKPAAAGKPASTGTAAAGTTVWRGGRCPASAVVLSLFATQSSYPKGQDPQFSLDAVNTVPGTCTLDVGPAQLQLVVRSEGRVSWDSADCAKPSEAKTTRLTRGVPVQESFTWNRSINLPGCLTLASSPRAGTYTAQAKVAPSPATSARSSSRAELPDALSFQMH